MKTITLKLGALALFSNPLGAFTQWGNGDIFVQGQLDYVYDSNLYLDDGEALGDSMFQLYTGLGFVQQERSVLNVEVELGMQIVRMFDFSDQNAEDWKSNFSVSYPNAIESNAYFELSGGWNENTLSNGDVAQRVKSEDTNLAALFSQQVTDKVGLEFSGGFVNQKYGNAEGPDPIFSLVRESETQTFALLTAYQYSEKLSGILTLQHRDLSYQDVLPSSQRGNVVALGFRGQLLPKVSGSLSLGIQDTTLNNPLFGKDTNTDPFYSVDLSWAPRDKTTVSLSGSSNFQASVSGDANNRKDIQLQVTENLSDKSSMFAGILYAKNDFQGFLNRVENSLAFSGGYFFNYSEQTVLNIRLSYEDRDSTVDGLGYDRLMASVGITTLW